MKPICVPCQRFFRMKKAGFYFIEGMPIGPERAAPGTTELQKWKPYKLWAGDRWECEGCKASIVTGCAHQPIAEHYQVDFEDRVRSFGATQLQVNDC